jgi:hypothetical protein
MSTRRAVLSGCSDVCDSIVNLLNTARNAAARKVNALLTVTYKIRPTVSGECEKHHTPPGKLLPTSAAPCSALSLQELARYALDGLPNKVMSANDRTVLPDAEVLQQEQFVKLKQMFEQAAEIRTKQMVSVEAMLPALCNQVLSRQ